MKQSKYKKLAKFGQTLLSKESLEEGLEYISQNAKEMTASDRCSIFIYEKKHDELWSMHADGSEKIRVPYDMGIVGKTIELKKPIIDNDPYDSAHFMSDIDMQTGYYTQNILSAPIFNSKQKTIGVIELLNKKGGFNKKDMQFLVFLAHYVSSYLEMMLDGK